MFRNAFYFRYVSFYFACLVIVPNFAFADAPTAIYMFPAGGQRGTEVHFRFGGYDLHDGCPLEMTGTGILPSRRVNPAMRTVWFVGTGIPLPASQAQEG